MYIRMPYLVVLCASLAVGCKTVQTREAVIDAGVPRELSKMSLPPYIIEPPDVILIEAVKIVPLPPYKIQWLDTLAISVVGTLPDAPISGLFVVDPDGIVRLGPQYGSVVVAGLTIEQAEQAVITKLKETLAEPQVSVELAQAQGEQQITGEHLVRPDGTISLGRYGSIRVIGMTLDQAKTAIEAHLSAYLESPEIYVDVIEYNTKACYVITDNAGRGERVARFTVTGNETVLDVISEINGLPEFSAKCNIVLARPAPDDMCCGQVLPVDWESITQRGCTATNYQVLPGDRIYIYADSMLTFASFVDKVVAPFERIFGFVIIGTQAVSQIHFFHNNQGGLGSGTGGGIGFP
jgi:polysaccharide export outer membrane protein